jgi:hypothetical protein
MVNNSPIFKKTNNHLSPKAIQHEQDHDMWIADKLLTHSIMIRIEREKEKDTYV